MAPSDPQALPKPDTLMQSVYWHAKMVSGILCFSIAGMLILGFLVSTAMSVSAWLNSSEDVKSLWKELKYSLSGVKYTEHHECYLLVSKNLNNLLNAAYGVSLYSVNLDECTQNFKDLVNELDKLYQSHPCYNIERLRDCVRKFCRDRRYK